MACEPWVGHPCISIHKFRGDGRGWGGLKVSPPCMKFLFKAIAKFFRKKGMFEEIFDFFG
jgi:hypothetical protein